MVNNSLSPSEIPVPAFKQKQPMHIPKAPQIVAERIKKLIVNGQLKEGDILPAEGKLMEEFGISRPTLREAYRILEVEHLVSISRGAKGGAVIHAPDPQLISSYALMVLQTEGTTVAEVYLARMAFEPSAVRLIIEQGRKDAPEILRAAIEHEREVMTDPMEFSRAIARFHRLIIELSGNRPLIHLWDAMQQVIEQHQAMVVSVYRRGQSTEEIVGAVLPGLRSQEKLVKLIEAGDEDLAEAHWRKHMQAAYKTWMTGYEGVKISTMMQE